MEYNDYKALHTNQKCEEYHGYPVQIEAAVCPSSGMDILDRIAESGHRNVYQAGFWVDCGHVRLCDGQIRETVTEVLV